MFIETEARLGQTGEYEAAIAADTRHFGEIIFVSVECRCTAFGHGHTQQFTGGIERPAVIEASQLLAVPAFFIDHFRSAMGAAVDQHLYRAVIMARHDYRIPAEFSGDEVAGLFDLALMADKQPRAPEQAFHFEIKNRGVGVDAAVDASGFYELCDVVGVNGGLQHALYRFFQSFPHERGEGLSLFIKLHRRL